jgi:F420-0:gamma-glutamyl ligase-like protein
MRADQVVKEIRNEILRRTGKRVGVLIVDSDKTYSFGSYHIAPRKSFVQGIRDLGPIAYFIGRLFKLRRRSTPVAVCGISADIEEILDMAEAADRARGHGAGPTVWDMADRFGTSLTGVSWEMLEEVEHRPIVIVKRKERGGTKAGSRKEGIRSKGVVEKWK